MAQMVTVNCKNCGDPFKVRIADRKRGWGKFCSKSCKAIEQTKRTRRGKPQYGIFRCFGFSNELDGGDDD